MIRVCCVLLASLLFALPCLATDTHKMFEEFQKDLGKVKNELSNHKISLQQAGVLLSGIQARQNQVLIYQNQKLLEQLEKLNAKHSGDKH